MTDPLFLLDDLTDPLPMVGAHVELAGDEGRHAAVVRRIRPGEMIMIGNGRGRGVRGVVVEVRGQGLVAEVVSHLASPAERRRFVAAQALVKGDRSELAVEMMTEMGIDEIVPWQASRSIVRWSPERAMRSLAKWQSTAREATKQSRRLTVPQVSDLATTPQLAQRAAHAELALLLHEEAKESITEVDLPAAGTVLIMIGPEGGITSEELSQLSKSGARPVSISDAVLRTSTAGVVALAGLKLRQEPPIAL
ncbi:MAG TPA: 16S rRNA (uracil(1498)-N(3))-methyltransferase [Propionibacteriaceae bacterium]|nr:16S rRNA (uracil(1498)-N(3))-methyltransferase [Propionibacteriaceae bacterium]